MDRTKICLEFTFALYLLTLQHAYGWDDLSSGRYIFPRKNRTEKVSPDQLIEELLFEEAYHR